ncbi:MAG: GNAT family N-acetyltransferase [Candidatus Atribacteria bacterium]|nr:GNAT family N-acetyltransferase [Candidatus Atribacteria bacterium]
MMEQNTVTIRNARIEDLPEITDIYNEAVVHSLSTFHVYPRTYEVQREWYAVHDQRYPLMVAEEQGRVVAWACLSPYSEREGYQYTVTDSIYVQQDFRRRGIGHDLLRSLTEEAKHLHYHSVIAVIARVNVVSIRLHERLGFVCRGILSEAGFKFGEWVDICLYQKILE